MKDIYDENERRVYGRALGRAGFSVLCTCGALMAAGSISPVGGHEAQLLAPLFLWLMAFVAALAALDVSEAPLRGRIVSVAALLLCLAGAFILIVACIKGQVPT